MLKKLLGDKYNIIKNEDNLEEKANQLVNILFVNKLDKGRKPYIDHLLFIKNNVNFYYFITLILYIIHFFLNNSINFFLLIFHYIFYYILNLYFHQIFLNHYYKCLSIHRDHF